MFTIHKYVKGIKGDERFFILYLNGSLRFECTEVAGSCTDIMGKG